MSNVEVKREILRFLLRFLLRQDYGGQESYGESKSLADKPLPALNKGHLVRGKQNNVWIGMVNQELCCQGNMCSETGEGHFSVSGANREKPLSMGRYEVGRSHRACFVGQVQC